MSQSKPLSHSLILPVLNRINTGIAILKCVRNNSGGITGFERLFANKKAIALFAGAGINNMYAGAGFDEWNELPGSLEDYKDIIDNGTEKEFTSHRAGSPFAGLCITCSRLDDGILMIMESPLQKENDGEKGIPQEVKNSNSREIETVFSLVCDVAELNKAREELKAKALLENIINTSGNAITVFNPVCDSHGKIIDFEYFLANETQLKLLGGKNLVGQRYSVFNDAAKEPGVLEAMKQVMDTGQPVDFENLKTSEEKEWFRHRLYKIGDMLMRASENITERKKLEEELKQTITNLQKKESLLREAERIGNMGSWERNMLTGELCWSDELYAIYGLDPDKIKPDTTFWLNHIVHPEDRKIAEKQIGRLYKKFRALSAEYRIIQPNGSVRTVYSEPEIQFDEHKKPLLAIGIVIDITETKKLEEQAHRLRLKQQNEVLNAILEAQEEERRRIAESLHNDLGQMLYMIKMKQKTDKKLADQLLDTAIQKVRTIAFDLMPSILLDYGLDTVLKDIVKSLGQQGITVTYNNTHPHMQLAKDMEISIFRILQELINNVIKHSGASKAFITISYNGDSMHIEMEDNGTGFKNEATMFRKGFGLRNIRNRLQIYSGNITIKPAAVKGTMVIIDLKIP